jgi:hypothetical protein
MSRYLLALCLSLFAAAALAGTPVASEDNPDAAVKPGKASVAGGSTQDSDATASDHPAATPAHASTAHAVSPRWHSLLPGMIR